MVFTSFLHENKDFRLYWESSKVMFKKISQNFIESPLKFCLISQNLVHSQRHVWFYGENIVMTAELAQWVVMVTALLVAAADDSLIFIFKVLTFHVNSLLDRQFMWNAKSYFLWKIMFKKIRVLSTIFLSSFMLSTLHKNFSRHLEIFSLLFYKTGLTFYWRQFA